MVKRTFKDTPDGLVPTSYKVIDKVTPEIMQGDTKQIKTLNAEITKTFIISHDVPDDESLSEAILLSKMFKNFQELILTYLERFEYDKRSKDKNFVNNLIKLMADTDDE